MKASAKRLLAHLHDKLVLDWRRKAATTADVRVTIRDVLDADLPADPYPPELFDAKVQAVFDHVLTAYGDDGRSVYDGDRVEAATTGARGRHACTAPDIAVDHRRASSNELRTDAEFVALVAEQLGLPGGAGAADGRRDHRQRRGLRRRVQVDRPLGPAGRQAEQGDGGRRRQDRRRLPQHRRRHPAHRRRHRPARCVGLDHDYDRVKPKNGDGFVNWLTTHLINALGHTPVTRTRARIVVHDGKRDLPGRRRSAQPAGMGQDQQGRTCLLRALEQLHSRGASR